MTYKVFKQSKGGSWTQDGPVFQDITSAGEHAVLINKNQNIAVRVEENTTKCIKVVVFHDAIKRMKPTL